MMQEPFTRTSFEAALDAGTLKIRAGINTQTGKDRWLTVRRNGQTRIWKRDPSRFRIPIKWDFRSTDRITEANFTSGAVDRWFRLKEAEGHATSHN